MARIAATDIESRIGQTINGSSNPTTTQVTNIIDDVYKQVYEIMYPGQLLHTTDDSTDTDGLVDNSTVFGALISWLSNKINEHFFSGENTDGSFRFTDWDIPDKIITDKLIPFKYAKKPTALVGNIRVYGNDFYDDIPWGGIP
jgi:hypothetical protein